MTYLADIEFNRREVAGCELKDLLEAIKRADEQAFERLVRIYRPRLLSYLRRSVNYEIAEDIAQNTFLSAYMALRSGAYRHTDHQSFWAWLRTIARHSLFHELRTSKSFEQEPIESDEYLEQDPERQEREQQSRPDILAEQSELLTVLSAELDAALIHPHHGQKAKDLGLVKKLAFMRFYLEDLHYRDLLYAANEDCARLGLDIVLTPATLNNWICRGDILKALVNQLVMKRPQLLKASIHNLMGLEYLTRTEQTLLHMCLEQGECADQRAGCLNIPSGRARAALASAKRKVAALLFRSVKQQLHELRLSDVRFRAPLQTQNRSRRPHAQEYAWQQAIVSPVMEVDRV